MDITVTGRRMQVTDALREYALQKFSGALSVFTIDPMTAEVVLHVEKNRSNPNAAVAEVTVFTKGHVIRAEEAETDMYAAIDLASEKVERQLRKYKTKVVDRRQRAGTGAQPPVVVPAFDEELILDESIIRTKTVDAKPMNEEEAMLQLDLLGHDFFVFTDDETNLINVLYRRRDGGYGLIQPAV